MKFALITGGTKGIGSAIAERLLESGYSVILNYANDDTTANNLYAQLNLKFQGKVFLVKQDLSDINNIESIYYKVKHITKSINVLVLNLGKTDRSKLGEVTVENWNSVLNTNLTVPFFLIQKFLPHLPNKSTILLTGSSMGTYAHSLSISYGVSKAAVHALVKNMVKFLALQKIRINAIVPGFIDTEWQIKKSQLMRQNIEKKIALNRFGSIHEVADACMLLICNEYINGELLAIDGGYSFE